MEGEECEKDLKREMIRTHARKITRCGCEAMITVKHIKDGKYSISDFHEEHTHDFVTPRKQHLIKSNREVSEKAKTTLFTCHIVSIGTFGPFGCFELARVDLSLWGAQKETCKIIIVT